MAQALTGGIPPGLDLDGGYIIQFTAVDATTGAVLTSVTVSDAALLVDSVGIGDVTGGFELPTDILLPVAPGQTAEGG